MHFVALHSAVALFSEWCRLCQFDLLDLILVSIESYLQFSFTFCVAVQASKQASKWTCNYKVKKKNNDSEKKSWPRCGLPLSNELDLWDAIFYRTAERIWFLFDASMENRFSDVQNSIATVQFNWNIFFPIANQIGKHPLFPPPKLLSNSKCNWEFNWFAKMDSDWIRNIKK